MKKKFSFKSSIGRKSMILAAVSLLLVMLTAIGATYSWIEDVSQVEFSSTDGQETPLHVGDKTLKSDANIKGNPTTDVVNLSDYFYASGDMHLSPCYGDGENFFFPLESGTNSASGFRVGTKDDANVNYLSATFRIRSDGANTAYWFEKSGSSNDTPYISFKKGDSSVTNSNLEQFLRFSVTIDGATNVYALNNSGQYYTVVNNTAAAQNGRRIDQYTYFQEDFNQNAPEGYYKNAANITNKPNQGTGNNLNGNTLYSINRYDTQNKAGAKIVTVKIWLEYSSANSAKGVDLASVNMNLVSSWAKNRRVYVKDATVHEKNYTKAKWLSTQGAKLYWALRENLDQHWELTKISGTDFYFVDIPAVYNNTPAVLFRCNSSWGAGSQTYSDSNIKYWDMWETSFPDTFHSETFTVYTSIFGTWEATANYTVFVNSSNSQNQFKPPYAYMWDSNSVHGSGINDKVVKNAEWTGVALTELETTTSQTDKNFALPLYVFYYNSIYDRIIFNDNYGAKTDRYQYQTQDLWLTSSMLNEQGQLKKPYFDMSTLQWYSSLDDLPKYSDVFLKSNLRGGNYQMETRFVYDKNGDGSTKWCDFYIKSELDNNNNNHYEFTIWDGDKSKEIKCHKDSGKLELNTEYTANPDDGNFNKSFFIEDYPRGVYRIYYYPNSYKIKIVQIENLAGK